VVQNAKYKKMLVDQGGEREKRTLEGRHPELYAKPPIKIELDLKKNYSKELQGKDAGAKRAVPLPGRFGNAKRK